MKLKYLQLIIYAVMATAMTAFVTSCEFVPVVNISQEQLDYVQKTGLELEKTNSIRMLFRLIPPGKFKMGSPKDELGHNEFERQHDVKIDYPFYMQVSEVTQYQYNEVMGTNPSYYGQRDGEDIEISMNRPVDQVDWFDCIEFCNKLSEMEGLQKVYTEENGVWSCNLDSSGYRLPLESEWEYACRAGTDTAFYSGSDKPKDEAEIHIDGTAWFKRNSDSLTHEMATRHSNPFGLHDMMGNIMEWCWDWFNTYPRGKFTREDLLGTTDNRYGKVVRGGWCMSGIGEMRSGARHAKDPREKTNRNGFRIARNVGASL